MTEEERRGEERERGDGREKEKPRRRRRVSASDHALSTLIRLISSFYHRRRLLNTPPLHHTPQFDRERIPERVVHARGASAKGFFEVTHDISHLTCADLFRAPGVQTPVIARFSTVIHERGSPESIRDPRGFAVKFYTREGNWDLVGNNMPVFFIRDGMKFPDMVHALKPNPVNHIQEGWRIADFFSHVPEGERGVGD